MTSPVAKARISRKAAGAYFTPHPVVRYIVRHTLGPLLNNARPERPPRILEPACGEGVFLVEAYRYLLEWVLASYRKDAEHRRCLERSDSGTWRLTFDERKRILFASVFGVDQDVRYVQSAKSALARDAAQGDRRRAGLLTGQLDANVRRGDALIGPDFQAEQRRQATAPPFSWKDAFAHVFQLPNPGFDAVIGNPPYVNVRVLSKWRGEAVKDYLKSRYRCARGCYDLYVLFLEKAHELLRTGGMCGLIVPNKIATMDYARPCRSLLIQQTTLMRIADVSQCGAFRGVGVYPYVVIWKKGRPTRRHQIHVFHAGSTEELAGDRTSVRVCQSELSADGGLRLHGSLDVESRTATRPLVEIAQLHSGTAGFVASKVAGELREQSARRGEDDFDFIVSGNIDRYAIRLGNVRFMKQDFLRPVLPSRSACLSLRKRSLYRGAKLVVAGMTRRLEAAYDPGGLALGVQVYAVAKPAADPRYVLALLNSKLLSYLFRIRFHAKQLAGRYLAINKGQLGRLPIRIVDPASERERRCQRRLVELAEAAQELSSRRSPREPQAGEAAGACGQFESMDREIDRIVYQLYCLTDDEIEMVESAFS